MKMPKLSVIIRKDAAGAAEREREREKEYLLVREDSLAPWSQEESAPEYGAS